MKNEDIISANTGASMMKSQHMKSRVLHDSIIKRGLGFISLAVFCEISI